MIPTIPPLEACQRIVTAVPWFSFRCATLTVGETLKKANPQNPETPHRGKRSKIKMKRSQQYSVALSGGWLLNVGALIIRIGIWVPL